MEYRILGKTGLKVSKFGFGASPFATVADERQAIQSIYRALELGVNFIDVAPYYGSTRAETILGKALQNIRRESYYLSTKVGRYGLTDFDFSAKRVVASVDESLNRLKVDYVDIIVCHDIEFGAFDQIIYETIPALWKVREAGKARFVGISGLPLKIFPAIANAVNLDVILSYCHYCLNDTTLTNLVPYLKKKRLGIINASPLAMGLLTKNGPPAWHLASEQIKACCAAAARHCQDKGVDIAKLALQFSIAQSDFATTLVGVANPEQITNNVYWMNETLDQTLLNEVQAILEPIANHTWRSGRPENDVHELPIKRNKFLEAV